MKTAEETRRYLVGENGWSNTEVTRLLNMIGEQPRTELQWLLDIDDVKEHV